MGIASATLKPTAFSENTTNGHNEVQGYFKVTDFVSDRKLICDFLLVSHANLHRILQQFRDVAITDQIDRTDERTGGHTK